MLVLSPLPLLAVLGGIVACLATRVRPVGVPRGAGRALCAQDPEFGRAVSHWVGHVVADRLHASRIRLLDLYAPLRQRQPDMSPTPRR
ncbi:hypothetical protein GCM10020295_77440 [Streptomyces cinereospinus]